MNAIRRVWDHFEEAFIAFLLGTMTLVTFVYVILNNLYTLFYNLGDAWPAASDLFFAIGDSVIEMAQAMTWSIALTKALFAWLIFFGLAYGVRTAGHIGVDALVKLTKKSTQRIIGLRAGEVVFDGPPSELDNAALTRIYGEEDWEATIRKVDDEDEAEAMQAAQAAAEEYVKENPSTEPLDKWTFEKE